MFQIFGSDLRIYGSDLKSIHHSDFYTHQFSLVAHTFPSLAPYPHGDTKDIIFFVQYDNIYDISDYFQTHIIYGKVLHHIGRMMCDPHHNFIVIQ